MNGRMTLLSWTILRLLTLVMLFTYGSGGVSDVAYYRKSLAAMHAVGLTHTLVEYPLPAVGVVGLPWLVARIWGPSLYGLVFVCFAMVTDGLFMWALHRGSRGRGSAGNVTWLLAVPMLGAVSYARFDLMPAVLVGLAVLLVQRHPRGAAVAVTVATGVKLWPALLIPPVVAAARRRREVLVLTCALGAAMVVATVALTDWSRLVSPLYYQTHRGLQVESVAATPAMVGWWLHLGHSKIWYAPSKAWEVSGAGLGHLVTLTTVATAAFAVALLVLWRRLLAGRTGIGADAFVWAVLASITGFMVLGRVLSPQYLVWLAPAAAAGLAVVQETRSTLVRWTIGLLVATGLTQVVYPVLYVSLIEHHPGTGAAVVTLMVRNTVLVVLLAVSGRMAWRSSGVRPATHRDSSVTVLGSGAEH